MNIKCNGICPKVRRYKLGTFEFVDDCASICQQTDGMIPIQLLVCNKDTTTALRMPSETNLTFAFHSTDTGCSYFEFGTGTKTGECYGNCGGRNKASYFACLQSLNMNRSSRNSYSLCKPSKSKEGFNVCIGLERKAGRQICAASVF